tara:strand:- start:395 stop:751 length:357 start_codon:yes stop_codon:yes gene_type:complete
MGMLVVAGQATVGIVYILGAITDTVDRSTLSKMLQDKRIPYTQYLLPGAISLKFLGGLALVFSMFVPLAAFLLAGFTLIANVIFHPFWSAAPADRKKEYFAFMVHMAVIGGLCVIAGR